MTIFLSHSLSEKHTIAYGGHQDFKFTTSKKMSQGDTCNQMTWEFSNHLGTHIDCPFHFAKDGKTITDYDPNFWFFKKIFLKNLKLSEDIIHYDSWCHEIPVDCELLIIKTDFQVYRTQDPTRYWKLGPGLGPDLAAWLRKNRSIRAMGFDFISVTSYQNRELGREAHRALLDPNKEGTPILPIEDMKLDQLLSAPKEVIVSPLRVDHADGSPVTVYALL